MPARVGPVASSRRDIVYANPNLPNSEPPLWALIFIICIVIVILAFIALFCFGRRFRCGPAGHHDDDGELPAVVAVAAPAPQPLPPRNPELEGYYAPRAPLAAPGAAATMNPYEEAARHQVRGYYEPPPGQHRQSMAGPVLA